MHYNHDYNHNNYDHDYNHNCTHDYNLDNYDHNHDNHNNQLSGVDLGTMWV